LDSSIAPLQVALSEYWRCCPNVLFKRLMKPVRTIPISIAESFGLEAPDRVMC